MSYKINTAVTGFGIGHFINTTTGAEVITGTPVCKRTIDGTGGTCANAASYNTAGKAWEIDLAAGDTNGTNIIFSFSLTGSIPISYTTQTVTRLVSELNDAITAPTASENRTEMDDNSTKLAAIVEDTAEIGVDGVGLSNLGGMSAAMKTEVQTEANDALVAQNLDHLLKVSTGVAADGNLAPFVVDETVMAHLMSTSAAVATGYNATTDSFQAIGADTDGIISTLGTNGAGLSNINLPNQTMDITGSLSGSVGSVTDPVETDSTSRTASKADVSAIPNTTEFELRTLPKDDYVVVGDTIAGVTTTANLTTNNDKTGYTLSASGIDSIFAEEVDNDGNAISLSGAMKLILSVLTGNSDGGGTTTLTFKDLTTGLSNRLSLTASVDGDRSAITRDAT